MYTNNDIQYFSKRLVNELQITAAKGILGCKQYERIFDRNTIYFAALTILAAASVPAAITMPVAVPILLGIGASGLLAYTIYRTVDRYFHYKNAQKLKLFYDNLLKGKFDKYSPDLRETHFVPYVSVDTLESSSRKEDLIHLLRFNLLLLVAINVVRHNSASYPEMQKIIEDEIKKYPLRGSRGYESLALLESEKNKEITTTLPSLSKDEIRFLLWNDFISFVSSWSDHERINKNDSVYLRYVQTYLSYLKQAFPGEKNEKHFALCRTLNDYYNEATKISSKEYFLNRQLSFPWNIAEIDLSSVQSLCEIPNFNQFKAKIENEQLFLTYNNYDLASNFKCQTHLDAEGDAHLIFLPIRGEGDDQNQKEVKFAEKFSVKQKTSISFSFELNKLGNFKKLHIYALVENIIPSGSSKPSTKSIKKFFTLDNNRI